VIDGAKGWRKWPPFYRVATSPPWPRYETIKTVIIREKNREEVKMRYKPKSIAALQIAVGGLPDQMKVEADRDIGVSAKTVGELRKVAAWPDNLVITTPQERSPESAIKVSKASATMRLAPKP
jgi:hypothetical protein